MNSIILILLLFYFSHISTVIAEIDVNEEELTLELLQVLFRHGARTPDHHKIDLSNLTQASWYEPWGLGQLTDEGKKQEFRFGKFLRARYSNYLRPLYKPEDVYAYATSMARTQMSLQLVLAGLYSVKDATVWDSHLDWSPIPYVSVPDKLNILLESHQNSRFKKLKKQVRNSEGSDGKFAKFSEFFKFLDAKSITNVKIAPSNTDSIFDVLTANEYMSLPLPDWYTPEVKQLFIEVENVKRDDFVATPELRKMGPGPLIKTFVKNMNLNGTFVNPRKIYLYGGQSANIEMFTRVHNISEFKHVPYGSALIFEKLKDSKNQVYVRLLAWDGAGKLMTLKLGNHVKICPIEDYLRMVETLMPSEEEIVALLDDLTMERIKELVFEDDEVTLASAK